MYVRRPISTWPFLFLASVAYLAVTDGSPGIFHSPQSSYAPPDDQYLLPTPYAGAYVFEEEYPAGRMIRSISNHLKKWVVGDLYDRKDTDTVYHAAKPAPKAETVEVKIPACHPVTEYITTRITENVAVRTHCMMKSIYRHPHKKDLMHQSSKCRGYLCNPQLFFDHSNPQTTSLQLPISMGPNPLASIFSNYDYDYDYDPSIGLDTLSVEQFDIPENDYYDDIDRKSGPLYSPNPSIDLAVKGVLVHVDRNVDFSKPNFGLPDHLFNPESKSEQLDYYDQSFDDNLNQDYTFRTDDYDIDYENAPPLEYKPPHDDDSFRILSDYDSLEPSLEYKPPHDDDRFRVLSDYDSLEPSLEYKPPLNDDRFRDLSDYDSLEDSIPNPFSPFSDITTNPQNSFSNVSFHSPRYYVQYSPNYVIPPESKGIDLSHTLRFQLPGNTGIPLPVVKNIDNIQGTISSANVGIPIPNDNINVGIGLPQDSTALIDSQTGFHNPSSGVGIPLPNIEQLIPNNGESAGIPTPTIPMNVGIGLPQESTGPIVSNFGVNNPNLDVGIPLPNANNPISNIGQNLGIPIINIDMNLGSSLRNSQNPHQNPNSGVGIPLPNTDQLTPNDGVSAGIPIPNNGMNVGIGLPQESTGPIVSNLGVNNPNLDVGIPLPNANNPISNNGQNVGIPILNIDMNLSSGLRNSQNPHQNPTSGLGIPLPNTEQLTPNDGASAGINSNVGIPIPNLNMNLGNVPQDSIILVDSQNSHHSLDLGVGIPIPNTDNNLPNNGVNVGIGLPRDSTTPIDSQAGLQNSASGVGIPLPNTDTLIPNNDASAGISIQKNPMNVGIGLPRDSTGPIISNLGVNNPNLDVGIPLPNADNPISNNGQTVGTPIINIDMNLGSALRNSQVPNLDPTSGVGIPLPNTDNGVSASNPTPNNGMNVGIGLPGDSTGPIVSQLGINNPNLEVGIPLPNAGNPISNNGQNLGIPISNNDANVGIPLPQDSATQGASQNIINPPKLEVGIPLPSVDNSVPNNGMNAHSSFPNTGTSVGIPLPQDSGVLTDSQKVPHNTDLEVGIPIPNADNSFSKHDYNVGIPLPGSRNNLVENTNPSNRFAEIVKLDLAPVSFDFLKPSSSYITPKHNKYFQISDA